MKPMSQLSTEHATVWRSGFNPVAHKEAVTGVGCNSWVVYAGRVVETVESSDFDTVKRVTGQWRGTAGEKQN
jgi:hypothetical protein